MCHIIKGIRQILLPSSWHWSSKWNSKQANASHGISWYTMTVLIWCKHVENQFVDTLFQEYHDLTKGYLLKVYNTIYYLCRYETSLRELLKLLCKDEFWYLLFILTFYYVLFKWHMNEAINN